MHQHDLQKLVGAAERLVFRSEDASNDALHMVMVLLTERFGSPDASVLSLPSLARSTEPLSGRSH